jgi:bifunctional non-homologous end joining protein LigD
MIHGSLKDRYPQSGLKESDPPQWVEPMLATLTDERFSQEGWIFERKFDGERCLAFRDGKQVNLFTRNHKPLNDTYPELAEALEKQDQQRFVLDGEIVAFEGNLTSFSRLQERMQIKNPDEARASNVAVYYYIFDILYLHAYDTRALSQRDRKQLLKESLHFEGPLRYTVHRNTDGQRYFKQACKRGWEGVIAKEAEAAYAHGRSTHWLKFKCVEEQEFVIGGFTDPEGSRIGFGALLVGYYEHSELRYAGKVGTGFDDRTLEQLHTELKGLERENPPFVSDGDLPSHHVHWTRPKLVVQVGFEEWTDDLRLRQPRYLGLREDKSPRKVHREKADS